MTCLEGHGEVINVKYKVNKAYQVLESGNRILRALPSNRDAKEVISLQRFMNKAIQAGTHYRSTINGEDIYLRNRGRFSRRGRSNVTPGNPRSNCQPSASIKGAANKTQSSVSLWYRPRTDLPGDGNDLSSKLTVATLVSTPARDGVDLSSETPVINQAVLPSSSRPSTSAIASSPTVATSEEPACPGRIPADLYKGNKEYLDWWWKPIHELTIDRPPMVSPIRDHNTYQIDELEDDTIDLLQYMNIKLEYEPL
jgi:hypothetical protein